MLGTGMAEMRNLAGSALMGSAVVTAVPTDVMTMAHWRMVSRLPMARLGGGLLKALASSKDTEAAVAAGFLYESASNLYITNIRYMGDFTGSLHGKLVYDKVIRASGLNKWTEGVRHLFGLEFMGMLAQQSGKKFTDLDSSIQDTFTKYRISSSDWDRLRGLKQVDHRGFKMIRPNDLRDFGNPQDVFADNEIASRFMDMMFTERDNAIMASSLRARATLRGRAKSGTVVGELLNTFAFLKNFPVTLAQLHTRRALENPRITGRLAYASTLIAGLTVSYAMSQQLKAIALGKDPMPMWGEKGWQFWGKSLIGGGGLGIYGDFLFSNLNSYGNSLSETALGPIPQMFGAGINLTLGNAVQLAQGTQTNFGREAVDFTRRWLPGSNLWWARLGLQRLMFDNLAVMVDPEAYERFGRQVQTTRRDYGQGYWWKPGRSGPTRAPAPATIAGEAPPTR
jgi:hypothetical protein